MAGAELAEFLAFGKQLGVVLAGASALWGFVFWQISCHADGRDCVVFEWLASRLLWLLFAGVGIALAFWTLLLSLEPALAHEGIALIPEPGDTARALDAFSPVLLAWALLSAAGLAWWGFWRRSFYRFLPWFFGAQFLAAAFLASFAVWTGGFGAEQWSFTLHNLHSIFTFGTVLILDYLFVLAKPSNILKQHFFPWFGTLSKVIWVGLGVDFLSSVFVFQEALALTPKFFFMQTVVGVLIVNGVVLAGPVARRLLESVKEGGRAVQKRWTLVGDVAGTVSIASWFTITFTDFFHSLSFSYLQFLLLYVALLVLLLFLHLSWNAAGSTYVVKKLYSV